MSINYRIENSTFLIAIPKLLNDRGYNSLIITNSDFDDSNYQKDYIKTFHLKNFNKVKPSEVEKKTSKTIQKNNYLKDIKSYFYLYKKEIIKLQNYKKFSEKIQNYIDDNKIEVQKICVIDTESLFVAYEINKNNKSFDFIYNSMELSFWDINRPFLVKMYFSYLFKKNLKICQFITLQDNDRKKYFLSKVKTKIPIEILPVGIDGEINTIKSNFLRDKFNIDTNKIIVLYSGSITSWACVYEIVENAINWKNDKCLVINGWVSNEEYFNKLKEISLKSNNIYINTEPVKWEDLDNLIASADIGLAIYKESDLNTQAIASSSNKLGVYSKSGVPIVINDTFSTKKMFETLKWGEGINQLNDLEDKIDNITSNYSHYNKNAYIAFDKYYNLKILSQKFIEKLTN